MNTMLTLLALTLTADSYLGRWNVKITNATDTFVSGGFQIEKKDGALQADRPRQVYSALVAWPARQ